MSQLEADQGKPGHAVPDVGLPGGNATKMACRNAKNEILVCMCDPKDWFFDDTASGKVGP